MVIVGAGIVGASIAYHLARQGQHVIVVEQAHPAAGATGRSFGWISEGVPEGAPDAFLRREIVADWIRLAQEIPDLWVNWSGALSYGQAPATQNPDNRHRYRGRRDYRRSGGARLRHGDLGAVGR